MILGETEHEGREEEEENKKIWHMMIPHKMTLGKSK